MQNSVGNTPVWDLTHFYESKTSKKIDSDIKKASKKSEEFENKFKSKLNLLSGDELANAIAEYENIEEILGKLGSYAYLLYVADLSNKDNAKFYQDISEKINDISSNLLFFTLEINKIDDKKIESLQQDSIALKKYSPWLRDVRVMRPYQLSDDVEKLMHEKYVTSCSGWHRLFDETIASLEFEFDDEILTCAEVLNHLSSSDAKKRKKAAKSIGKTFGKNINLFAFITNILAKDKDINDKWRGFESPIASRNISNLIEDNVAGALIETVKNNYSNLSHRYYKLKASWFGKKQLDYWDRNAPLPNENSKIIKWENAVEIVLDAYKEFSPEMASIGKRFFDEKWIDAKVIKGKDSGAFSHPTVPSVHPYILMNYQGKTRDIMTLAHELGHGVHQVLSAGQGALMADTPLTLAETASVFGEQLTFRSLLKGETNELVRRNMIAAKVEDMLNTVVRQVAFCEFEKQVHNSRKNGELSVDKICDIWLEVQKESLGDAIKFEDEYKYYWAYIPHFIHTPFYVYAYAFGDCLVNSFYRVYQNKPDGFVEKYIQMLKAGGTLRHKELLAPFELDASDPNFWQGGLDVISEFIDMLE